VHSNIDIWQHVTATIFLQFVARQETVDTAKDGTTFPHEQVLFLPCSRDRYHLGIRIYAYDQITYDICFRRTRSRMFWATPNHAIQIRFLDTIAIYKDEMPNANVR
jgi:hypothetical protein